jgi:hypothetical protein
MSKSLVLGHFELANSKNIILKAIVELTPQNRLARFFEAIAFCSNLEITGEFTVL